MRLRNLVALFCMTATAVAAQQTAETDNFAPLSTIPRPIVDQRVADLGYLLFFDPRLSGDSSTSCSECHDPGAGWTDGADLARGYPGTKHWRNSQTVVNSALVADGLHWDGGLATLLDQVHDAMGAGFVANIDMVLAEERLRQIPEYRGRFQSIWSEEPSKERLVEAIAAYESTLISEDSPFDRHMAGDSQAMSAAALRGMEVFSGKGNCTSCHNGALLSDGSFHNITVPANPEFAEDPLRQVTFRYLMRRLGLDQSVYENLDRDPGRYVVSKAPDDLGAFRTPPLRYLRYTAPYMHNGVFFTLDEVVEFYNIGGTQDVFGTKSAQIQPLGLTREEKQDLVAFLESLSGSELRADTPDLPEYNVLPGPDANAVITAARLKGEGDGSSDAVSASQSGRLPDAPPGLRIETPAANESGLTLIPRGSNTDAGSDSTAPAEGSELRLTPRDKGADAGRILDQSGERFVTVKRGDTLRSLAVLAYGDEGQFRKILDANADRISDSKRLEIGGVLRVPG